MKEAPYTVKNAPAPGFMEHRLRKVWSIPYSQAQCWEWLNSPETFINGQIPPFRVEFLATGPAGESNFTPGVICSHFGPLMNFSGEITSVENPSYRDLQYFYGSYALSLWCIRPTRLQFWIEPQGEVQTQVTLQVDSYVRKGFATLWSITQHIFWSIFPMSMKSGIKRLPVTEVEGSDHLSRQRS